MLRRRVKHQLTLQDRIVAWAKEVEDRAAALPPGPDREMLLKKVQQAETALHFQGLGGTTASEVGNESALHSLPTITGRGVVP